MVRLYQKRTLKTWKGYELVLVELMVPILVSKLVFSVYTIRWNVRCVRQYALTDKLHSELRILDYLFYYVCKDQQKNWLLLYNCELTNFLDQFRSLLINRDIFSIVFVGLLIGINWYCYQWYKNAPIMVTFMTKSSYQ